MIGTVGAGEVVGVRVEPDELLTGEDREIPIEDHEVRLAFAEHAEGLGPVRRLLHPLDADPREHVAQNSADIQALVHDEGGEIRECGGRDHASESLSHPGFPLC